MGPAVKGNPLQIFVLLLVTSYVIGEFILPKYALFSLINLIGIIGLILSLTLFFSSLNLFNSYKENPRPQADTNKIIKTGIFAYCRNPMYLAFISFHLSMFLTFENVAYFLSAIGLFVWINTYVIPEEENFLEEKFGDEYSRYLEAVKKWMFF
ncbi:MAG: isoprenylcysteine carboxylmethyltransferase family protein [Pelagibacteraceae bacterium]|jgi:protein-S-isoprenylcysteine O-methyltransferase Ste14|nr:isoprenylcysteine carboxylmethyltransferase family protein [Pelagibacteraceae bacterium]MBT6198050.1 isoprenylcysteine carboxylmethyltransferase family protein [Pelagibacteraceae bacterium]MBT6353234.1 isoprenylcysteine carboxylmethyltransferase family protein [Pelagibacteraceae bacterium]